ncbi:MAG: hypothetical protein E3J72_12230 [Planctomycetota bacterium]|nr:MAG: hypothetical protein E3J72_12230 [Planctomycetota bacterium]
MSDPLYMQKEYRTANEPKVHSLVRKSFVFVPSAGMRLAPEVLVLELMREVFFPRHYEETGAGTRDLDADKKDEEKRYCRSVRERAVLHALRGRRKKTKQSRPQVFFAPAYPGLAKYGWLRKSSDRVINNLLLSGPIAQHLWGRGPDTEDGKRQQQELADSIREALLGKRSCLDEHLEGKDLLAATLGPESFEGFDADPELPTRNIVEKTRHSDAIIRTNHDELAARVTQDLLAICSVEGEIPRMQWLQLLMTFLRFALPMWLLAQMQITRLLHSWLLEAVDNGRIFDMRGILQGLAKRNRGLLHPTLTATRELFEHIERYMKCRVEVNILLYCLEQVRPEQVKGKRLTHGGASKEVLALENLLVLARDASSDIRGSERFKDVAEGLNVQTFLTREGEQFSAWRNPLMKGQGKNIDEFFRVLYRAELGDEEGGYLLAPEGRGAKRGFRVFPGQLLLKTATYLAAQDKWSCQPRGGAGKLVLQDVEELFGQYGVDFSIAADARPLLMKELQAMGLLTGSPDAGSSVAVACPY